MEESIVWSVTVNDLQEAARKWRGREFDQAELNEVITALCDDMEEAYQKFLGELGVIMDEFYRYNSRESSRDE